jgi:hypothetical protein
MRRRKKKGQWCIRSVDQGNKDARVISIVTAIPSRDGEVGVAGISVEAGLARSFD